MSRIISIENELTIILFVRIDTVKDKRRYDDRLVFNSLMLMTI